MIGGSSSGNATRLDYPVHQVILSNQTQILGRLFYPNVLARIQDTELKFPEGEDPLHTAGTLLRHYGCDLDRTGSECRRKAVVEHGCLHLSFRRGLQREHLKQLIKLVLDADSGTPEDARSLARHHLGQINTRIQGVLQNAQGRLDDYSWHTSKNHKSGSRRR